ncbi:MAG: heat-inducible transcriptional repressor HrcA [Acidimicrobiales bacterium]
MPAIGRITPGQPGPRAEASNLEERKAAILRAVVTEYVETATPVGSGHVVRAPGVSVSAATVRNDMVTLEHDGFLTQPHTSAGRIPTDKGYRFFVDQLAQPVTLQSGQSQQVKEFFTRAHGELEQMLHDTSTLLSRLTDQAAVVVSPTHEVATIRSVQLVALNHRTVLLVAVLSNGGIEKRTLELSEEAGDDRLAAAGSQLMSQLMGRTMGELVAPAPTGDPATDAVVAAAVTALGQVGTEEADQVFVGGASRMATAFEAVETVRSVLSILEQQYVVVSVLKDVMDRGLSVAIGSEHGVAPLAECALVVARYEVEGEDAGSIGVLGPTRMNYPQALAAVAVVGERLGRYLSEG